MQTTAFKTLLFTLSLGSFAFAQESMPDLARARSTFASADVDKSGDVSLREATASGHSLAEFRGFDLDGDGALTQSEFIVGYKERMGAGGSRVAPDLENEARRILAERRAEQADATRRRDSANTGPGLRRTGALQEAARTSGIDPERIHNQIDKLKGDAIDKIEGDGPNAGANADPRSRATNALQELQRRQSPGSANAADNAPAQGTINAPAAGPNAAPGADARGQGPNAPTPGVNAAGGPNAPAAGANAARPGAPLQRPDALTPGANAPGQDPANAAPAVNAPLGARPNVPATEGPGVRRLSQYERVSPEELQRLFRQRRERAASDSTDDPRAEAERERLEKARQAGEARRAGDGETGRTVPPARGAAAPGRGAAARGGTPARGAPSRSRGGF
jgi:hypothetical protein